MPDGQFGDFHIAARMRDANRRLAKKVLDEEIPRDEFGVVSAVDETAKTATVMLNGATQSITVLYGHGIPPVIDDVVRVTGHVHSRYIAGLGVSASAVTVGASFTGLAISELPAATLPLTGAEILPMVQSLMTKRATVQDILNQAAAASAVLPVMVTFSYPGALDNNVESPPWYPPRSATLISLRLSLLVNATSTHTIALRVNGVQHAQYSISAGNKTITFVISKAILTTDAVTIKTITVADSNLSVQVSA